MKTERNNDADVVVVGAGPAGLAAALTAARAGARVTVFDENGAPGGQLVKQIHKFFGSRRHLAGTRGFDIASQLTTDALAAGVEIRTSSTVMGVFGDRKVAVFDSERCLVVSAGTVIVTTGASENAIYFPGGTLPGVMTAGAAQTMINVHRVRPGSRAIVVGSGNVGLVVAYQMLQAGIEVPVLVEALPGVGGYEVHAAKLRRCGVEILCGHTILSASGQDRVERAVVGPVDGRGSVREFEVDLICLAVGLSPLTDLLRMAGARHVHVPELGGYIPAYDELLQTTVPGIYVAGNAGGIEEAASAIEEGRLAAVSALAAGGFISPGSANGQRDEIESLLSELRAGPFGVERRRGKMKVTGQQLSDIDGEPARKCAPVFEPSMGPFPVIECTQEIPCDPCGDICPVKLIEKRGLTEPPVVTGEGCTGCGLCVAICPGQAIFLVDLSGGDTGRATVPYEALPMPVKDQEVDVFDGNGQRLGTGRVTRVADRAGYDETVIVTVEVPRDIARWVRSVRVRRGV